MGIRARAGELASIVDVEYGSASAGISGVDGREDAVVQQETTERSLGVEVEACDLATAVDAEGLRLCGTRRIDGGKAALRISQKAADARSASGGPCGCRADNPAAVLVTTAPGTTNVL